MGVVGLWPLIKKKGYDPAFRNRVPLESEGSVCRLDVLGTFYLNIRSTYIRHPPEVAHEILERQISNMVAKEHTVLYIDGEPAKEKAPTHAQRNQWRKDAAEEAEKLLAQLHHRVTQEQNVRKWMVSAIKKATEKVFVWSAESRAEFARYLEQQGWQVLIAPTEADLAIALDCGPQDVVISKDSDMVVYKSINHICRPISKGRFLDYDVQDVAEALGMSRQQLCVLGIVSRNDYNRNIPSLGSETNFKLVKEIVDSDPARMVENYLSLEQVMLKNTTNESFENARRVFIDLVQDPVPQQFSSDVTYDDLTRRLQDLSELYRREQTKKFEQRRLTVSPSTTSSSSQTPAGYNRYRTVDRPPNSESSSWRPRYSCKTRVRILQHEAPKGMVRYRWKPHRPRSTNTATTQESSEEDPTDSEEDFSDSEEDPSDSESTTSDSSAEPLEGMSKLDLTLAMRREHPISTLEIGTVRANTRAALQHPPADISTLPVPWADVASAVDQCLKDVTRIASDVKRSCQLLVGRFVEQLSLHDVISSSDRDLLDLICPRIPAQTTQGSVGTGSATSDTLDDETVKQSSHGQFFTSLAIYVYSGSCVYSSRSGAQVERFINRAHELGLCEKVDKRSIKRTMPYAGSTFLRSVGTQLASEYKRHYNQGTRTMQDKALKLKERRPETFVPEIHVNLSAVENFLVCNKANKKPWKLAPLSPVEHGYINISERELVQIFFKNDLLKRVLLSLVRIDFRSANSHVDVTDWLRDKEPGYLIRRFIAHLGKDEQDPSTPVTLKTKEERRRLKSYKGAVRLLSLDEIRDHVGVVRDHDNLDVTTYQERGYVALGSIKTDGFKVQLLAFKLKELQCARFKRLPEDRLPDRLTSTVAGVNYHMKEIRNVVKTGEDVTRIWNCDGEEIKVLGIDLGQAFVVGVSAILPDQGDEEQQVFYNLAVS
ncbi:Rad2 nuclease [Mortierella alpina]|nr:Rad2 nuclease [Mortierella alpina]